MKKYTPISNELSVEVALVQAAHVLDIAVQIAIEEKNTERLQSLALSWMELAGRFYEPTGDDDDSDDGDDDESGSKYVRLGFSTERVIEE